MTLYPPSSLNFLTAKGKWYVYVTIPPELRPAFNNQTQLRRSTGTSDRRVAKGKEHSIASLIYADLDKARKELNPVKAAFEGLLKVAGLAPSTHLPSAFETPEAISELLEEAEEASNIAKYGFVHGDEESEVVAAGGRPKIEAALEKLRHEVGVSLGTVKKTEHLSALAKDYIAKHPFSKEKTRDAVRRAVDHFIDVQGDLIVTSITKKDAYDFASSQASTLANKTIANRITFISQCLSFGERSGRLTANPFKNLELDSYGRKKQSYTPLDKAQLEALFALPMPQMDRKLLSILIATGMRLDEAALLEWEDVKEQDGIPFFDLTTVGKILKNTGSARKVPIVPDLLPALGTRGTGRLFDYRTDRDGKAQAAASKALMRHIKKIRGADTSKTVHSLRGTLKDLLRDADVQKETHDFITGHGSGDVAGKYGSGPSLKSRYEALLKVDHPWLRASSSGGPKT